MASDPTSQARRPLTGTVTIEWVDASEPDDPEAVPNFGWTLRVDRPLDDRRLRTLLLEVANSPHLDESEGPGTLPPFAG
jgi:hypothetical protein